MGLGRVRPEEGTAEQAQDAAQPQQGAQSLTCEVQGANSVEQYALASDTEDDGDAPYAYDEWANWYAEGHIQYAGALLGAIGGGAGGAEEYPEDYRLLDKAFGVWRREATAGYATEEQDDHGEHEFEYTVRVQNRFEELADKRGEKESKESGLCVSLSDSGCGHNKAGYNKGEVLEAEAEDTGPGAGAGGSGSGVLAAGGSAVSKGAGEEGPSQAAGGSKVKATRNQRKKKSSKQHVVASDPADKYAEELKAAKEKLVQELVDEGSISQEQAESIKSAWALEEVAATTSQ